MTVTVERTLQGWRVSAMLKGYRVSKHYIGYTKRDAIRMFKRIHK
jgi:hypothetical protein